MGGFIEFAEVTGAVLGALGLALGLEWATLNGLIRLMPISAQGKTAQVKKDRE